MRTSQTKHISELANLLVAEYAKFNKPCVMDGFLTTEPLELDSILHGNHATKPNGITINSFERIIFLKQSRCVRSGRMFYQALGYRNNFNDVHILILKTKKNG